MNSKRQKAEFIALELERLFPQVPIPLQHTDPYTLLVAVLLSAQCTDVRVNQVTPRLFAKASCAQQMVDLSVEEIEAIVRPCGLAPRKARAIWDLSFILLDQFAGKVPDDIDALESLPGVGHKTASVVLVQAFGKPAFPVDTHIHRLAQQWGLTSGKNVAQTEADLKRLFPESLWAKLHLQMILFGRECCPARRCDGLSCHICRVISAQRKRPRSYNRA